MTDITEITDKALGAEINRRLSINGRLTMVGFGSLKRVTKPARMARNPRTGEPVQVPARETVVFKASK
jgi:nucleoid DNA-binding protein